MFVNMEETLQICQFIVKIYLKIKRRTVYILIDIDLCVIMCVSSIPSYKIHNQISFSNLFVTRQMSQHIS